VPVNLDGQACSDTEIDLDGGSFVRATLTRCILVYSGGVFPNLSEVTLRDCQWKFGGAAANALGMLAIIRISDAGQADELVALAQAEIAKLVKRPN
jgi:hypothetical protein